MMTVDEVLSARIGARERWLQRVWLVPIVLAAVVTLTMARRLEIVAPLVAVALVPWAFHAWGRQLPRSLFGVLGIAPVVAILVVEGLDASVFLGMTALSILASRVARVGQLTIIIAAAIALPFCSALGPLPFDPGSFYFAIGDVFGVAVGILLGYSLRLSAALGAADARLRIASAQEERTRLARDVHDLVAHSLTVVVLHIGGARRIIRTDPASAERALEQAEQTCRESLDGIRRVVGLLRTDGDVHVATGDVAEVVETYRSAGVDIHADLGESTSRPPLFVVSLLQRVTIEALANAARYRSAQTPVEVTRRITSDEVTLTIVNASHAAHQPSTGGYGLVGLREQVTGAGGTLTSGFDHGLWRVECRIPLSAVVSQGTDE